jgi:hypothetical protein
VAHSDISKVFEVDDIFTRKDAISGLKSSLGRVYVNWSIHLWTVQFLLDDITTFNIGFPIPYTFQKSKVG